MTVLKVRLDTLYLSFQDVLLLVLSSKVGDGSCVELIRIYLLELIFGRRFPSNLSYRKGFDDNRGRLKIITAKEKY